ncbi:hypothetical protein QQP08_022317, partial [Theobroma cacao]
MIVLLFHGGRRNGVRLDVITKGIREGEKARAKRNYYELLGVSADSNQCFPPFDWKSWIKVDRSSMGHEYTLMLNEVYQVLIKDDMRRDYDASIGPIK